MARRMGFHDPTTAPWSHPRSNRLHVATNFPSVIQRGQIGPAAHTASMRRMFLLAALAVLLIPSITAAPGSTRPFAGAVVAYAFVVEEDGNVQVDVTIQEGLLDAVRIDGPGTCRERVPDPGARVFFECGFLQAGNYRFRLFMDGGAAAGYVRLQGAAFAVR